MFQQALPKQVDYIKAAQRLASYHVDVPVSCFVEFEKAILSADDQVRGELKFSFNDHYQVQIKGHINAKIHLICQRCMEPVEYLINAELNLVMVSAEQEKHLDKRFDPWLIESEAVDLNKIVEQELIIALPIVVYHDNTLCNEQNTTKNNLANNEKENPFLVLNSLKKKT